MVAYITDPALLSLIAPLSPLSYLGLNYLALPQYPLQALPQDIRNVGLKRVRNRFLTKYISKFFRKFFEKNFEKFSKNFPFWLGGAAPQTPRILAGGGFAPLDGFSRGAAAPWTPFFPL